MKKFKKLIALTCVAAMLVPTIAFAADGTDPSGEMNGNGVVENDNAPAIDITNVVLPTTSLATDTYDFTIDAAELLSDVDAENYDDTLADGVWFKALSAAPQLAVTTDADSVGELSLVEKVYVEDTGFAIIGAELATKTDLSAAFTNTYAVWVPDVDGSGVPTGNGKYQVVTNADIEDYFKFEFTTPNTQGGTDPEYTSMATKQHTSENDNISNGKLYVLDYVAIDPDDAAAKYYDADASALKAEATGTLFVKDIDNTDDGDTTPPSDPGETTYTQAALAADPATPAVGELVFNDAEFTNKGTSSQAVIINKSTFDIKVSAKVTVSDATGLTFEVAKANLTDEADDASIYMAIKDGTNEIAILGETPTATATLKIAGVDPTNSTLYQTAGPEAVTGSHQYYRYLDPVASYNEAYFEIYAATDASDDWDAYVEAVKQAGAAPKINVVYSWE
ncbi:MAG: hypothetical protein IJ455_08215, partial [Agathobacter sp.]|nr:hypothetical protein [Agathobacter sp.]